MRVPGERATGSWCGLSVEVVRTVDGGWCGLSTNLHLLATNLHPLVTNQGVRASELIFQRELHDARVARGRDAAELHVVSVVDRVLHRTETGASLLEPVKGVERLEARLQPVGAGEPERAHERHVEEPLPRAVESVAAGIA